MNAKSCRLLPLIIALAVIAPVHATEIHDLEARHLIKQAELIFQGVVSDVHYKLSDVISDENIQLPHTFVTFKIEEIFKGTTAGETITLRFQGGSMQVASEADPKQTFPRYLMVSKIPLFDIGDRQILYVQGNGASICPLVGMNKGRLRVIEGYVYSDYGRPLVFTSQVDETLKFHPEDILHFSKLAERLADPQTLPDAKIASQLSDQTRETIFLLLRAGPESPYIDYAKGLLAVDLNRLAGFQFLKEDPSRLAPPSRLFAPDDVEGFTLRTETQSLLTKEPSVLTRTQLSKLNRLVIEDVYADSFVKSLERTVATVPIGISQMPPVVAEQVLTHQSLCGGCSLQMKISASDDLVVDQIIESPNNLTKLTSETSPQQAQQIEFKPMPADEFTAFLKESITELHTPEELRSLEPVVSLDIRTPFYVNPIQPGLPLLDIGGPSDGEQNQSQLDRLEAEALAESGFNPVLKQDRP